MDIITCIKCAYYEGKISLGGVLSYCNKYEKYIWGGFNTDEKNCFKSKKSNV